MRTFNGQQPWEVHHAPKELALSIGRYRRAIYQTPKTSGQLKLRRKQMRKLAREIGPQAQERLELVLELLHAGQAELWKNGPPDPQAPAPVITVHWSPAKRGRAYELLPELRPSRTPLPLPASSEPQPLKLALVA